MSDQTQAVLRRLTLVQLATVWALRETTNHGLTAETLLRLVAVSTPAEALQLLQGLNDLCERGLVRREVSTPFAMGAAFYSLTSAGREAAP